MPPAPWTAFLSSGVWASRGVEKRAGGTAFGTRCIIGVSVFAFEAQHMRNSIRYLAQPRYYNLFRTPVPVRGQATRILGNLSLKRDSGRTRVGNNFNLSV